MKSVMQHSFSQVPRADIQRSTFNRVFGHKTTLDAGYLYPIYVDEALPGDTFNLKATMFARMATPIFPIMDNLFMDVFFFAVPNRLVWEHWQNFCGEKVNPDDVTEYTVPQIVSPVGGWTAGTLSDYMGLPVGVAGLSVCAFWHRAYNLIYREWFRDQNIIDSPVVDIGDAASVTTNYVLRRRGKRHDYFTSCLPWPQKGESVDLPLGTTAPVLRTSNAGQWEVYRNVSNTKASTANLTANASGVLVSSIGNGLSLDPKNGLYADLSGATAATINSLRLAFQLQKLLERDARGGTRYVEILKAHFNVTSPDFRLQRPEYLGGSVAAVQFTPVAQTSGTVTSEGDIVDTPQATLAAVGTITAKTGFTKSFTEHCVVIGLVAIRADLTYQQGLNRMWSRTTKYDFYWPALQAIGEQAVLTKEIFCDASANDEIVFGYQEAWAEYRYKPSMITGKFRSSYAQSLDAWHLSQDFETYPTLSETFIEENPPMSRIKAVTTEPDFIFDSYFEIKTARPMPVYSVPGLIDHF